MSLIKNVSLPGLETSPSEDNGIDPCFKPFVIKGFASLTGDPEDQQPVRILRDTGGSQSIIREGILPLSSKSSCHSSAVVQGVGMGFISVPLHNVHLRSSLVSGFFKVAVRPALPIKGVDFILGNDLAGGKVMPVPEVLDSPGLNSETHPSASSDVFPACVVTRAQSKRYGLDLSDSFLATEQFPDMMVNKSQDQIGDQLAVDVPSLPSSEVVKLPATREEFITAQQGDVSLLKCRSFVVGQEQVKRRKVAYVLVDGLLRRRWSTDISVDDDWTATYQVVVPSTYRSQVLSLAHDHPWSGHMGVTKTYNRVLKHFFWPGLKSDVVQHCRTCHVCQVAGKPNQVIPPAALCPIPVMGEPFEKSNCGLCGSITKD